MFGRATIMLGIAHILVLYAVGSANTGTRLMVMLV